MTRDDETIETDAGAPGSLQRVRALAELSGRLSETERAVHAIERAVTRLDSLVEGVVDSVPDFITRRVRSRASSEDPRLPITERAEGPPG